MNIYELIEADKIEEAIAEIKNGGDINVTGGYDEQTVAMIAATKDSLEIIKLLKEAGVDLTLPTKYHMTAFDNSITTGQKEIIEYFLDLGIGGASYGLNRASISANLDLMKFFIEEKGADVNFQDMSNDVGTHSYSSLHKVAQNTIYDEEDLSGVLACIKYLLEKGADINSCDMEGNTVLHMTTYDSSIEVAQYLLDNGADKKAKNNDGKRAFNLANSKQKAIKAILK